MSVHLTVSRVLQLAVIVSTLMVGGLAAALLLRVHEAQKAGEWVEHTHEVISTIQAARLSSLRASLWLRNYFIAPREDFLQRTRHSAAQAVALTRRIQELTMDNAAQHEPTARAASEMSEVMGGILAAANTAARDEFEAARTLFAQRAALDLGNDLRAALDQIEATERRLLAARTKAQEEQNRQLRRTVYLLIGAFALVMVWVSWQSARLVRSEEAQSKRLEQQAMLDPLTGLLNRRAVSAALDELVKSGESGKAFLVFDLNGFKAINDKFGHAVGDLVLQETGRRLKAQSRQGDLAARLGGDEFLLILAEACSRLPAQKIALRLCDMLRQPIQAGEHMVSVGAAVGVAVLGEDGTDLEAVLDRADARMYEDKRMGKSAGSDERGGAVTQHAA